MVKRKINTNSIKDQIYEILKEEIVTCKIKSGAQLVEQTIADQLNVSRSPVREAIQLLAGDGLVVIIPNKGAFVKKPTLEELDEMLEMRQLLEIHAINKTSSGLTDEQRKELCALREALINSKSREKYFSNEKKTWAAIIKMANNSYILDVYEKIYAMLENFTTSILTLTSESFARSLEERLLIIDSLLDNNIPLAVEGTIQHINHASEIIHEALEKQQEASH